MSPYVVHILDRSTGDRATSPQPYEWVKPDGYTDEYWWSEGNFSCDCNRALEFWRAKGKDEDDPELADENTPCQWEEFWDAEKNHYRSRFVVRCVSETGEELYRDEDWEAE